MVRLILKHWLYGAIYGAILGALTAFAYRISDAGTFFTWTVVSLVALSAATTSIEWYGSKA